MMRKMEGHVGAGWRERELVWNRKSRLLEWWADALCICVSSLCVCCLHVQVVCADTCLYYTVAERAFADVSQTQLSSKSTCARGSVHCVRARRSRGGGSQVINASEKQLWSGLARLEISFREERQRGRMEGKRRGFHISCQINKSKQGAFTVVSEGKRITAQRREVEITSATLGLWTYHLQASAPDQPMNASPGSD